MFPAQAADVIYYLQDTLAQCRAEVEQHKAMEAKYYPQDLRAEVGRVAELELLLRHVLCQADENSTINLDAIRAALEKKP